MSKVIETTLGKVCDFVGGSQPEKKIFSSILLENYVRLVQIRDYKTDNFVTYIPKDSTRKFCTKKDIMIGRYGPPIFQILRGIEGAYNVALMKAIPKKNIINDYLYYFLCQEYLFEYINALSPRTGGQTGVDVVMLKQFPIYLPSIQTQKQIAKVLSDLDAKIEINNKINQELEAMAKTLYDYWFVQFDFPNEQGRPYKSNGGKMVFNEDLKSEIPEGWEVDKIGNLLKNEVLGEKIKRSEYLNEGKIPIIDQSTKYIIGFTNNSKALISTNDYARIVFGDHTRIVKFVNFDFARGADGTQILLSNEKRLPQHLFYYSILRIDLSNYGYARHFKFLKDINIILPSFKVSSKFEKITKSYHQKIKHIIDENQQLTNLRDWLLPMLMNGQVSVVDTNNSLQQVAEPRAKYGE